MVYRKRGYRRRGGYRRKKFSKPKRYQVADMAYSAYRGVRALKGLVNVERHFKDNTSSAAVTSTGSVTHLTGIAQGDDNGQRQGNSILLKTLNGTIYFHINPSAVISYVRCVILRDKQCTADNPPAVTDVLQSTSTISHLNTDNVGRFSILKNYIIELNSTDNVSTLRKINLNFKNSHVRYNGTTAGDYNKDPIFILLLGSEAVNTPTVGYDLRVSFFDN